MKKALKILWLVADVCVLMACGIRVYLGYPVQGIVAAVFACLLLPPVFLAGKYRRKALWAVIFCLGVVLIAAPIPKRISYEKIMTSLRGDNRAEEPSRTDGASEPSGEEIASRTLPGESDAVPTEPAEPTEPADPTKPAEPTNPAEPTKPAEPVSQSQLSVICLDVGQGDATLLLHTDKNGDSHAMMIDGGGRKTSSFVVARLERLGVTHLENMVCTHYDADHSFGLIGCYVKYADEKTTVFCPDYVADTEAYKKFVQRLDEGIVTVRHPEPGDTIPFGDCDIRVLGPVNRDDASENNLSIVLLVSLDGVSFYFPGDCEERAERAILDANLLPQDGVTVYHAAHHGSYSGSCRELMELLRPEYTVVSVGQDNAYGHPHDVFLERIAESGCDNVFRTDRNGEVVFTVSEGKLSVTTERDAAGS